MDKKCVACDNTANDVPLISLDYKDQPLWVCPQHMPLLIHKPEALVGKLPGAEDMKPADDL
jgi:hypothetical protein